MKISLSTLLYVGQLYSTELVCILVLGGERLVNILPNILAVIKSTSNVGKR